MDSTNAILKIFAKIREVSEIAKIREVLFFAHSIFIVSHQGHNLKVNTKIQDTFSLAVHANKAKIISIIAK